MQQSFESDTHLDAGGLGRGWYDVIVVGGSCSGLRTAELLAISGKRVLVLERKRVLEQPERTWIVTPHLHRVLGFQPHEAIVHRTGVMRVIAGRSEREVRLQVPDLVVERARILPMLAQRAQAAGADLLMGAATVGIVMAPGGFRVLARRPGGGEPLVLHARDLIGADGVKSMVAQRFQTRAQRAVPIVQARVALPAGYDPDVTAVWFDRARTRFFYWLIPESTTTGALGLIAESSDHARELLDDFMREHGFTPISYQGAMIPLHQPFRRIEWNLGGHRVLLVGDAAAHVKVTTVGGLVSGLWGAQAAARAIAEQRSYRTELRTLHAELHVHDLMRWVLDRFSQSDYEQMLGLIGQGLQSILGLHNRDTVAQSKWSLLAAQPRILALAARVVLFS
ncbi:MAG: NAD(P)/FAD-dependent oxidoreductase [Gemmatimonadota bacterium]